jgi:hypothetical protein
VAGGQQLSGPQDEQGGGDVAELERRHTDHQSAQPSDQDRPDPQPQRLPLAFLGAWGVMDGVHDGGCGQ